MALVVLQIQDQPNGQATLNLTVEPPVLDGQPAVTDAEKLGLIAMRAVRDALVEANRAKGPKLVIVGADELPH